uniref:WAP, Kazal, immunoglobulin, Kunitz and NTR domain-containing protein 2-like n=1 Tax=Myxine glutinosa TaxID=7769 RepID=UPI00358E85FC
MCPNEMNPNMWVDAQSTCNRECSHDQDCKHHEKCCSNVCGLKSCVAARFRSSNRQAPVARPKDATCDRFMCTQQGSECDIWDGQAVCKCRDRCEKEPNFTCASDGLTYYNHCYMDAEACNKGITLKMVTCRYQLTWQVQPSSSPGKTTAGPTTSHQATVQLPTEELVPPVLLNNPEPQTVIIGATISLLCEVNGRPRPEITWEKQNDADDDVILMRPDHVYGHAVITNIGQLVIYNARATDAGIYTCSAANQAGMLRANFHLSIIASPTDSGSVTLPTSGSYCQHRPEEKPCGEPATVHWYFYSSRDGCVASSHVDCNSERGFQTYVECNTICANHLVSACSLPPVQGPCHIWEARWAYNPYSGLCNSFVYGGCEGNGNNFMSRSVCEDSCPFSQQTPGQCKPCRTKQKLVSSFCHADFAIVGHITEMLKDGEGGLIRFSVEEIIKDEKMGLRVFNIKLLEITLPRIDWSCPCPNVTNNESLLLVMGQVRDGMAMLQTDSYVRSVSEKKAKKLQEIVNKKSCDAFRHLVGKD